MYNKQLGKHHLNVFRDSYLPWRRITNWPGNIKQFFRNIKYAVQRVRYGFCEADTWNLDEHLGVLISNMLVELADNTHGYPYGYTVEEWDKFLRDMAQHMINSTDAYETVMSKKTDMAAEEMHSYVISDEFVKQEDGLYRWEQKYSDEEAHKKALDRWLETEKDLRNFKDSEKDTALNMLKTVWFNLWD